MSCDEGWGMSEAKSSARVASSEASAKKEMWFKEGKAWIRLKSLVDSIQNDRCTMRAGARPSAEASSSLSNMDRSMMMDLRLALGHGSVV